MPRTGGNERLSTGFTCGRRALSEPSMFNQGSYYPPAEAAAYGPDSMHEPMCIDTSFDFRTDASEGP
jgi:hypothetical protein